MAGVIYKIIIHLTVAYMKRWGLRVSSLYTVAKVRAGQEASRKYLTPNVIYTMLCGVF